MYCQLEMLQNCLPQNVRRVLRDLPNSLDETYERVLREIGRVNPDQAYRLLQCLVVAIRPLDVDELAEVLALDFDEAKEGIPVLNEDWRWDDQQQHVLSTCSSLIVVVNSKSSQSRVVQFAHFSVKEFLTSDRLSNLKADISRFHIHLEPAHTVLAQACLATLLQSDYIYVAKIHFPLSDYATEHWVDHAQFENVSSRVEDGLQRLFDPGKPYISAWLESYDIDKQWWSFIMGESRSALFSSEATASMCLYYAALCGFRDLTTHLIAEYPQHVNARVGLNQSPLAAALYNRHVQVADLLHQHGAVLPTGCEGRTLLHAASNDGLMDVAQWLLHIGADANAKDNGKKTPLHLAAAHGHLELVRTLLGHSVDANAAATTFLDPTPLHEASEYGRVDIVRLLIQNGANVNAGVGHRWTPLHLASYKGNAEIVRLLIKHGAGVNTWDRFQQTPLHVVHVRAAEIVPLLIQGGADVDARDWDQQTPLHLALFEKEGEAVQPLIQLGADVNAQDENQTTPLHLASSLGSPQTAVRLLIEHGAGVNAYDKHRQTPLHWLASSPNPCADSLRLLLENGADVDAEDDEGWTPFQIASSKGISNHEIARLLSEHRASVMSNRM